MREDLTKLESLSKLSPEEMEQRNISPIQVAEKMVERKKYLDEIANVQFRLVGAPIRSSLPLKKQRELGMLPCIHPSPSNQNSPVAEPAAVSA